MALENGKILFSFDGVHPVGVLPVVDHLPDFYFTLVAFERCAYVHDGPAQIPIVGARFDLQPLGLRVERAGGFAVWSNDGAHCVCGPKDVVHGFVVRPDECKGTDRDNLPRAYRADHLVVADLKEVPQLQFAGLRVGDLLLVHKVGKHAVFGVKGQGVKVKVDFVTYFHLGYDIGDEPVVKVGVAVVGWKTHAFLHDGDFRQPVGYLGDDAVGADVEPRLKARVEVERSAVEFYLVIEEYVCFEDYVVVPSGFDFHIRVSNSRGSSWMLRSVRTSM